MAQGASAFLGRTAIVAAALGALLLTPGALRGDDRRPPHPVRSGLAFEPPARAAAGIALLIDDCDSFTDAPAILGPSPAKAPGPGWQRAPGPRAIPVVWLEYRGLQPPLRGTGSDWIYVPFDGCAGSDTGDFDLRNPSGTEAVGGARYLAIGFETAGPRCGHPATTPRRLCVTRPPGSRPAHFGR